MQDVSRTSRSARRSSRRPAASGIPLGGGPPLIEAGGATAVGTGRSRGDEDVINGATDRMLLYGAGAVVGPEATSSYVASPPSAVAAASGAPVGTTSRLQQLLAGAAPANAQERQLLQTAEGVLRSTVSAVTGLAAEGARQAKAGRDIYGNPLQRAEDGAFEQRVLDLVNVERVRAGLQPLTYQRQLDAASEGHAVQMARAGTMAHVGIGDGDPGSRILAQGFRNAWGENLATGQLSPEQVVREWMASPGHRRNIMDPNYRFLGVSYTTGADGRTYWAQSFGA